MAKETGKKAREKRARGSGTGDTKADRRRSGRAAAFDKEKERVKPPKTVVEPVVAETLVEDDVADLPDKVAPFTPLKKTGQVGLYSTPIVDDINFDVDIVQHSYTAHTGEERFAMNVRACGYRNESVFTLLTPPELFKQCGVVWGNPTPHVCCQNPPVHTHTYPWTSPLNHLGIPTNHTFKPPGL